MTLTLSKACFHLHNKRACLFALEVSTSNVKGVFKVDMTSNSQDSFCELQVSALVFISFIALFSFFIIQTLRYQLAITFNFTVNNLPTTFLSTIQLLLAINSVYGLNHLYTSIQSSK